MKDLDISRQNDDWSLDLLCAEEFFKRRARLVQATRLVFALGAAAIGLLFIGDPSKALLVGVVGLVVTIGGLFADRAERQWVKTAASVKDLFDARLMGLAISTLNTAPPNDEEVIHRARSQSHRRTSLSNWYPDPGGVPPGYGRLICQRASVVWDLRLRKRVGLGAVGAAIALIVLLLTAGLVKNLSLQDFLISWVAPLSALLVFLLQVGLRNLDASRERASILQLIEAAWADAVARRQDVSPLRTNTIQDAIFRVRSSGPVVPRLAQRLLDRAFWDEMNVASERLKKSAPTV